jgi:ubiquinone/menaquinone biosynthesis C-methylase UbiE
VLGANLGTIYSARLGPTQGYVAALRHMNPYLLGGVMADVVTQGFIAGVDVSEALVAVCERRYQPLVRAGRLELSSAPVESLPYPSGCFSKACTANSLFYWSDALQALRENH